MNGRRALRYRYHVRRTGRATVLIRRRRRGDNVNRIRRVRVDTEYSAAASYILSLSCGETANGYDGRRTDANLRNEFPGRFNGREPRDINNANGRGGTIHITYTTVGRPLFSNAPLVLVRRYARRRRPY